MTGHGRAIVGLYAPSSAFMTYSRYGRLQSAGILGSRSFGVVVIALATWLIASCAYSFMIAAHRIGIEAGGPFLLFELKVIQGAVGLTIHPFVVVLEVWRTHLQWSHVAGILLLLRVDSLIFWGDDGSV